MAEETPEIRLRRLHMRSIRRGIKEMDLILGSFARSGLSGLGSRQLDLYEKLLEQSDHDLYRWVSGATPPPDLQGLIDMIRAGSTGLTRPG